MNYQDRVKHEQIDLSSKIHALGNFIVESDAFPILSTAEQSRLKKQMAVMSEYNEILLDRITCF